MRKRLKSFMIRTFSTETTEIEVRIMDSFKLAHKITETLYNNQELKLRDLHGTGRVRKIVKDVIDQFQQTTEIEVNNG